MEYDTSFFRVPLEKRDGMNLLICGYHLPVHRALLLSVARSLYEAKEIERVIFYSPRQSPLLGREDLPKKGFEYWNTLPQNLPDFSRTVLIIDGLEQARDFHPPAMPAFNKKPDDPLTHWDWLKNAIAFGPLSGSHVIALCDNWRRLANISAKDLSFFGLRMAVNMNEDDTGAFLTGQPGNRVKGLDSGKLAAFYDMTQSGITLMRPFADKTAE
jgi:hypothetical protein